MSCSRDAVAGAVSPTVVRAVVVLVDAHVVCVCVCCMLGPYRDALQWTWVGGLVRRLLSCGEDGVCMGAKLQTDLEGRCAVGGWRAVTTFLRGGAWRWPQQSQLSLCCS